MKDPERLDSAIPRIENVPLRVEVAGVLRQAILNGSLRPGTPIVEMSIAEQLNVSRAPVREAIQLLEKDGLIETAAYKGKRVKPLSRRDVEELYTLREQFELFAVRRIIAASTNVDELDRHCWAMREAAEAKDFDALNTADEAFHRAIIRLGDHDLLLAQWNNLYLRIRQLMALRNITNQDLRAVAQNHPPIVAALKAGDFTHLSRLIHEHIGSAADLNLASIEERQ